MASEIDELSDRYAWCIVLVFAIAVIVGAWSAFVAIVRDWWMQY